MICTYLEIRTIRRWIFNSTYTSARPINYHLRVFEIIKPEAITIRVVQLIYIEAGRTVYDSKQSMFGKYIRLKVIRQKCLETPSDAKNFIPFHFFYFCIGLLLLPLLTL